MTVITKASCENMASSMSFLLLVLGGLTVAEAQLKVFNLRASDLPSDVLGISDGYVKVSCGQADLGQTSIREDNANPWWEEEFIYFNAQENNTLTLEVYDSDIFFDDHLGTCKRQIKVGTHEHECYLEKGGTLHYFYTLSGNSHPTNDLTSDPDN